MKEFLLVLQIVFSVLLIVAITAQARGGGFARSLGGGTSFTRRGLEKLVFKATFVLSFLFIGVSILQIIV